jgi:hypothetical protein
MNQSYSQTVRNLFSQFGIWSLGAAFVIGLIALMIALLVYVPIFGLFFFIGLAIGSFVGSIVFILYK